MLNGYSLLELTLVVLILGIMAAAVVPSFFSATGPYKLDLVAEEIAQALRFAQNEARRTGQHYGATISQATQTITVKKWDITTDPVSTELVPYHPVSKKGFVFDADGFSLAPGVSITNASDIFLYDTIGRRRSLIFDKNGMPVWITNAGVNVYRLLDASVTLSDGDNQSSVMIAPITGRVTVQ
ncbi:MAG: prepilin-type N-terminal cleavage/methylation domain-containing protein [Gammaproteobacteria bacterium]|nr:prepilin-type N-terminal cleavage/methylation domain-containing protein [Gammaproteobacteria bacterium]